MCTIDRYVIKLFVKVFLVCFISLTGIYIVSDFVGNLTEFVDRAEHHGSLWTIVAVYYGSRVPWFFDLSSRMVALTSSVFAVTWLQRHNEMTALMAAGMPRVRIVAPLIGAVTVISLAAAVNRELGIPAVRDRLTRNAQDWTREGGHKLQQVYDNETGIWLDGASVHSEQRKIHMPRFRLPGRMASFGPRLVGEEGEYLESDGTRPSGYVLKRVSEPENLNELSSIRLGERPAIFAPRDHDWLLDGECFVASNVSVEYLEGGRNVHRFLSTAELLAGLRNPSLFFGPDVRILVHTRLVQPVLDVTLLFMGLPLVLSRESRNVFVASGLCVLVVAAFFIIVLTCQFLGMNYLISPALAAWCPLIIFLPCAVAMSEPLRR